MLVIVHTAPLDRNDGHGIVLLQAVEVEVDSFGTLLAGHAFGVPFLTVESTDARLLPLCYIHSLHTSIDVAYV